MQFREQRLEILKKVESGQLTVDESNRLLEALERQNDVNDPATSEPDLLGEHAPALHLAHQADPIPQTINDRHFQKWRWAAAIPFWLAVGFTTLSAYWMHAGYMKAGFGWGFFLAWIPFLLGLAAMYLFWGARWLHVRIRQKEGQKPKNIIISLPLPFRAIAWIVRIFRKRMPAEAQNVDEMISSLDGAFTRDTPFHVFVDDEDGEQVEVFIG